MWLGEDMMEVPGVISTGSRLIVLEERLMTLPSEEYRTIPLTKGQVAIVDAADFEWLSQWKWYAAWDDNPKSFYAKRSAKNGNKRSVIAMQRVVLGLDFGDRRIGDHISGDTLDNRRCNLRICTPSQSSCNRGLPVNSGTGYKGVHFDKKSGKYRSHIKLCGHAIYLGTRDTPEEAHVLYCEFAEKLHGEFLRKK
jgi:hypothetical protein